MGTTPGPRAQLVPRLQGQHVLPQDGAPHTHGGEAPPQFLASVWHLSPTGVLSGPQAPDSQASSCFKSTKPVPPSPLLGQTSCVSRLPATSAASPTPHLCTG